MSSPRLGDKSCSSSLASAEDDPWFNFVQDLSDPITLDTLKDIFYKNSGNVDEPNLDKPEFEDALSNLYGNSKYSPQASQLPHDLLKHTGKTTVYWQEFLDYLLVQLCPKTEKAITLSIRKVEDVPHSKRESIRKIVVIESKAYFCYAIISKHGRIGLYDGNLNFLTSYHVLMTREDVSRTEEERRRRNRWVTDAIFCADVQMFVVTNSARTVMIYEASGLEHVPYWLIIGLPNIAQCISYKNSDASNSESVLFLGCFNGDVMNFKFLQPNSGFLRRKHSDKVTIFYWKELEHEQAYLDIKILKGLHENTVKQIEYFPSDDSVITCSIDPNCSVMKKYLSHVKKPYIYKLQWGCNCFSASYRLKMLITGSLNGIVRIWNPVIVSKPTAVLSGHNASVIDVVILESQEMLLSFSEDGELKLWDLREYKCFQTLKLAFPSFDVEGRTIEFSSNNILPGPKRMSRLEMTELRNNVNKCLNMDDVVEKSVNNQDEREELDRWERSCVLVTCCNHVAEIRTTFKDTRIEGTFELPVLPPPPLQNSVLIPFSWRMQDSDDDKERNQKPMLSDEELMKEMNFILNMDLFDIEGSKSDINYKIAVIENKKLQGAPFELTKLLCTSSETGSAFELKIFLSNSKMSKPPCSINLHTFHDTSVLSLVDSEKQLTLKNGPNKSALRYYATAIIKKEFLKSSKHTNDKEIAKSFEMQANVAKGAPYLALDLFEIEDFRLSEGLPVPNKKKAKVLAEKTEKLLSEAHKRDLIFSEPTSSRSQSSKSGIVEFPL